MPNAVMAVAFDQGDNQGHGVHPRFKTKPAQRLALQLLFTAFGSQPLGEYSGPLLLDASSSASPSEAETAANTTKTSVTVRLSHATGLRLNDTRTCNEQFKRLCCGAGATAFGARICTAANAADCARDADGKTVFNANVTIGMPVQGNATATIVISALGVVGTPTFVDYGQTDFPQCSVVNHIGVALGPFGPTPVQSDQVE